MPAEWTPHAATWLAWPHGDTQWCGMLEPVREEFAGLVEAIARVETVELLVVDEEAEADARKRLANDGDVRFHRAAYDDVWLRDTGPIFVARDDAVALTDWEFNGWGGKYPAALDNRIAGHIAGLLGVEPFRPGIILEGGSIEVNGAGLGLTTRQCLLSPQRNAGMDEKALEGVLREYLGLTRIVWLDSGLEGDHTDGHIDTITRFAGPTTIVTSVCADRNDPNYERLAANLDLLKRQLGRSEVPFTIVEVPVPEGRFEFGGERLPLTYVNFYIANGLVVVPAYGAPEDAAAIDILRPLFPNRTVVSLPARALITGGGAFHCVTQQQPVGQVWSAA